MLSRPDFLYKNVIIIMTKNREKLSFRNDNLIVKNEQNEIILQNSCYRIFSIWIIGPFLLTSGLIQRAKKFGFSILFFTFGFRYIGSINSKTEGNVLLREKQYKYNGQKIGKYLIKLKIQNQVLLLKSIRHKMLFIKENIKSLEKLSSNNLYKANKLDTIMGIEGAASKLFFTAWFHGLDWKGRKPRTKIDPNNLLLDIGYTMLFNYMDAMLNLYGFDTYCGLYHRFFYQRKSLVCDLVEPFRCVIDKQIRKSYNLNQIKMDDFHYYKMKWFLSYKRNKPYIKFLMQSILDEKEEIFVFVQKFYRAFINQRSIEDFPNYQIIR